MSRVLTAQEFEQTIKSLYATGQVLKHPRSGNYYAMSEEAEKHIRENGLIGATYEQKDGKILTIAISPFKDRQGVAHNVVWIQEQHQNAVKMEEALADLIK